MVGHIIERNLTHLFFDGGFILAWAFGIHCIAQKCTWLWMPRQPIPTIAWAGALALICALCREPYDIKVVGDWWGKSYFDIGSHLVYVPLNCWAFYRLGMWFVDIYGRKDRNAVQ